MYRLPFALLPLALVVLAAIAVAALSGGDPPKARAAHPGPVARTVTRGAYRVALRLSPNRPAVPNRLAVRVTRAGRPVTGAKVTATLAMAEMDMGRATYRLPERAPGLYARDTAALFMAGDWRVGVAVTPPAGARIAVQIVDRAGV